MYYRNWFVRQARWGGTVALLLSAMSCGSSSTKTNIFTVSGVVTLNGKPLPDATLIFLPDNGRSSAGKTDDSGRYFLFYNERQKGAVAGRHRVQITAAELVPEKLDTEGQPVFKQILPAEYNAKSEMAVEITSHRDDVNFDLKTKNP
ncbi:MAG TPA: carboxypeptidase-like regulatory domain-containing protein [Planctomicrobium sp.]|nr:carboxypeptidase-like regulatory domain-containing protein [Planctomicrobium sp.]